MVVGRQSSVVRETMECSEPRVSQRLTIND